MKCIFCGSNKVNKIKGENTYECVKCEESFDDDDIKQVAGKAKKDKNKKKFTGDY